MGAVELVPLLANLAEMHVGIDALRNASQVIQGVKFGFGENAGIPSQDLLFDGVVYDDLAFEFRMGFEERRFIVSGRCLAESG
jgi:hypothetical protein